MDSQVHDVGNLDRAAFVLYHPALSQAVTKGSDLSTVLAFMPIIHIDKDIVQGVSHAIPGKRSALAKRFGGNIRYQ